MTFNFIQKDNFCMKILWQRGVRGSSILQTSFMNDPLNLVEFFNFIFVSACFTDQNSSRRAFYFEYMHGLNTLKNWKNKYNFSFFNAFLKICFQKVAKYCTFIQSAHFEISKMRYRRELGLDLLAPILLIYHPIAQLKVLK